MVSETEKVVVPQPLGTGEPTVPQTKLGRTRLI